MMRTSMRTPIALILLLIAASAAAQGAAAGERPNILFILADDQGYGDVGCYGEAIYRNRELVEKVKSNDGAHTEKLLAAGIEFMKSSKGRPFCLYYTSPLPHTRWMPSERFKGTSPEGTYGDVVREIDWQFGKIRGIFDLLPTFCALAGVPRRPRNEANDAKAA